MFRAALLSFLVVAAQANLRAEFETKLRSEMVLRQLRNLQLPDNFEEFQFNFAGYNFNAAIAMEKCPTEWDATFQCLIKDCPNALDVCPDLTGAVPEEYTGTAPPGEGDAPPPMEGEGDMPMDNATAPEEGMPPPPEEGMTEEATEAAPMEEGTEAAPMEEGTEAAPEEEAAETESPVDELVDEVGDALDELAETSMPSAGASDGRFLEDQAIPECAELEAQFCDTLAGEDTEDCCLTACTDEIQALLVCVIREQTGVDRSDCEIPECPTGAPGGSTPAASTPAPAPASAATTVSRVAALSGSLLALAVL